MEKGDQIAIAAALALATGTAGSVATGGWAARGRYSPRLVRVEDDRLFEEGSLHNAGELALAGLAGEANGPTELQSADIQPLLEVPSALPSGLMDDELEPPSPPSAQQADSVTSTPSEALRCAQGDERAAIPVLRALCRLLRGRLAPQLETLRAVLEVTTRAVIGGADPALAGFVSLVYKAFCEGHLRALLSGLVGARARGRFMVPEACVATRGLYR